MNSFSRASGCRGNHADLDRFIAESEGTLLSTDDNLYLEHATPKGNVMSYERSLAETVRLLQTYRAAEPLAEHLRE